MGLKEDIDAGFTRVGQKIKSIEDQIANIGVNPNIGFSFAAYNNSQQTSASTSFDDIIGWTEEPNDDGDSIFSFNALTGVLTVNHTGIIFIGGGATLEQTTGNNRAQPRLRMVKGTTQINGMRSEGYTRQTGLGDREELDFQRPVAVTSGDTFKMQMGSNSTSFEHRIVSGTASFWAIVLF